MRIVNTRIQNLRVVGQSSGAVTTDEYFNLVSLLLPGNGTNGQTNNTFQDSSTNAFTITRAGNTTQGTFSPFSQTGWSNYFDGADETLRITPSSPLDFGTGDFTVELWALFDDISVDRAFIGSGATGGYDFVWRTSTGLNIGRINVAFDNTFAWTPTVGVWYHIVYCRSGTSLRVFVNGTQIGSTATNSISYNSATTFVVGGSTTGERLFLGYLSNMRLIKGTALYTSNFTPPTAPLTAVSGTSLLTCQSNRFIDNSTNAFAITVGGNPSVQAFSPFDPATAYAAGTVGGSAYFDGTDYLSVPDNAVFDYGTGSFTVETWIYTGVKTDYQSIIGSFDGSLGWYIHTNSGGTILFGLSGAVSYTGSRQVCDNAWHHVAMVRNGPTDLRLYVDGVLDTSATNGTDVVTATEVRIGSLSSGFPRLFTGYIASLRVVKGTAVYTSAFTPPTAPVTAIANTSLLLNYTNGGITDAAAKNVLETVGGAAISTAQSKFGGSSMAFDGSGDYVIEPTSLNYGYGTGDFTIEFWLYLNSTGVQTIISQLSSNPQVKPHIYYSSGVILYVNGADVITGGTLTVSTWNHIAVSKSGSSTKLFINGTQSGSTYTDTNNYGTTSPLIIADYGFPTPTGANQLNGYIDDLRITRGYARYTANFTPPTTAFPTQ